MKKAAIVLAVAVVVMLVLARTRLRAAGVVGDALVAAERKIYTWAGLLLGLAAVWWLAPLAGVAVGYQLTAAAVAFVGATALGDARLVFQTLGLWPRRDEETCTDGPWSICIGE